MVDDQKTHFERAEETLRAAQIYAEEDLYDDVTEVLSWARTEALLAIAEELATSRKQVEREVEAGRRTGKSTVTGHSYDRYKPSTFKAGVEPCGLCEPGVWHNADTD